MMASKHVGIVACSSEGAALCYRTFCLEAAERMGEHLHPEVSMHTHSLGDYMAFVRAGDWDGVATLMLSSAEKLARAGADFFVCPDNTVHQSFEKVRGRSPRPWLHIAQVVAAEAKRKGYSRLGILGTRYLMEGPVYPAQLEAQGIDHRVPDDTERSRIDSIIFDELVKAKFDLDSRRDFADIIDRLKRRGCDAVVLGCTEIPLLISAADSPLPILDSTRLLARAALEEAIDRAGDQS
jgi:aspartate racemase